MLADVLLKINKDCKFNLNFFHMNYNMHSKSVLMYKHCRTLALKNKIPFFNINIDSNKVFNNTDIESKARKARYEELKKICLENNINYILTAHHEDDQIETIYMCQQNNSSWISNIGIRKRISVIKRREEKIDIFRPMLSINKKNIIEYAKNHKLLFYDDPTNSNLRFLRNKVRLEIAPKINDLKFRKALLEISRINKNKLLKISAKINKKQSKILFFSNRENISILNKKILLSENFDFFVLFIKKILNDEFLLNYIGSTLLWKNLYKFILTNKTGKSFDLGNDIHVCDSKKYIFFYKIKYQKLNIEVDSLGNYKTRLGVISVMMSNQFIKYKKGDGFCAPFSRFNDFQIENWTYGDKCISNNNLTLKVSDIFINNKLSLFEKENYPIVKYHGNIVWIPNLFQKKIKSDSSSKFIHLKWNFIL
mgnify:CR=1 FL=1